MAAPQAVQAGWPRWRLAATLVAVLGATVALLAGLVLLIVEAAAPSAPTQHAESVPVEVHVPDGTFRDRVAAAPMLPVRPEDADPTTLAVVPAPAITIPGATGTGAAGVPSGFPHTGEGAVGQLAAIEVTVLEAMSLPSTRQVYGAWALPEGVGVAGWELTRDVQGFLAGADQEGDAKDDTSWIQARPAAGMVKGVDGPDWVVACVLLEVRASVVTDSRMGYGHCERMQWTEGRWMIAPGTPPAHAPSVWPGTDLAARAGWRTWTAAAGASR